MAGRIVRFRGRADGDRRGDPDPPASPRRRYGRAGPPGGLRGAAADGAGAARLRRPRARGDRHAGRRRAARAGPQTRPGPGSRWRRSAPPAGSRWTASAPSSRCCARPRARAAPRRPAPGSGRAATRCWTGSGPVASRWSPTSRGRGDAAAGGGRGRLPHRAGVADQRAPARRCDAGHGPGRSGRRTSCWSR